MYGQDVETLVQEEDAQPLTEPIIAPVKTRKWAVEEKGMPETRFDKGFLLNMTAFPEFVRNVAVVGNLHHGKTALLDMLVFQTHKMTWDADAQVSPLPSLLCASLPIIFCCLDAIYRYTPPLSRARNFPQIIPHVFRPRYLGWKIAPHPRNRHSRSRQLSGRSGCCH